MNSSNHDQFAHIMGAINNCDTPTKNPDPNNLLVVAERDVLNLRNELKRERDTKQDLEKKLLIANKEISHLKTSSATEKHTKEEEIQDARAKSGIKLVEALQKVEHLESRCLELERKNQHLRTSLQDEVKKAGCLANSMVKDRESFDKIMLVWTQRVASLQADLEASERESRHHQAELFKSRFNSQKSHQSPSHSTSGDDEQVPAATPVDPPPRDPPIRIEETPESLPRQSPSLIDLVKQKKKEKHRNEFMTNVPDAIHQADHNIAHPPIINKLKRFKRVKKNSNSSKPFSCKQCGSRFVSKASQKTHHRRFHTNEKNFFCDVCNCNFIWKHELALHMAKHTGDYPYKCMVCKKGFNLRRQLDDHSSRRHSLQMYHCKYCGVSYKRKASLTAHKQVHRRSRGAQHECDICHRFYKQKSSLNAHMDIHHPHDFPTNLPFKCDTCGRTFSRKGSLSIHRKVHTQTYDFKCPTCDRCFREKHHLRMHEKIHLNVSLPWPVPQ